jgi:16S rRNA (guanine(966)-N(2))-methyltransferase RsmD
MLDRMRETLFNILQFEMEGVVFADLYAGTGAVGIEALSRGASWCDFVESDVKAQAVIRENLTRTGLLASSKLYPLTVARALSRLQGPYDLVVADPPYEYDRAESELAQVVTLGLLAPDGTLAVEHSQRKPWPETLGGRTQAASRRYGDTRVTFYR